MFADQHAAHLQKQAARLKFLLMIADQHAARLQCLLIIADQHAAY